MSLLLSFLLLAQDVQGPLIDAPKGEASCPADRSVEAVLCRATRDANAGRHVEAARAFEEAAPMSDADRERRARIELAAANMWLAANRPGDADKAIGRALEHDEHLSSLQRGLARIDRARAVLAMGEVELAIAHLTEAEEFAAADPFLWYMKGSLLLDSGRLAEARAAVDKGLALADDAPELLLLAGHVAMAEGDEEQARTHWTAAAARADHPSGQAAAQALAGMNEETNS